MTGIVMYDADDNSQFPPGAQAYAGYVNGRIASQPNFAWVVKNFPAAHHLSITLFAGEDGDALDVENGAASVTDVPGWWDRQRARGAARPCIYASASVMEAGIVPLIRSGRIPRASVRLWSAHYAGEHVCGPSSCGAVGINVDGCQWTPNALGRNLDESLLAADFFGTPPATGWTEAMIANLPTLAQGATGNDVRTVQALATARGHATAIDGAFGPATATSVKAVQTSYGISVDGVCGQATWTVLVTGQHG